MVDDGIEWELEDLDGGVLYDGATRTCSPDNGNADSIGRCPPWRRPTRACGSPGSDR